MASTWQSTISMARRCSSRAADLQQLAVACLLSLLSLAVAERSSACPFCNAVLPTFCQSREAAEVVALGEVVAAGDPLKILVRNVLKGREHVQVGQVVAAPRVEALRSGALCLLLGSAAAELSKDEQPLSWTYRPVTETSYAYFARAPQLRVAAPERLRYFARYLEHPDTSIAEDAYLEFGHAPFDVVAQAADALPIEKIRRWILDDNVPEARKGFYGLALGIPSEPAARAANAQLLQRLVNEPDDDFRAGFGGILGGYLLAAGLPALELIEARYLSNPNAADGDVRSALSALRFYHEYGKEIPPQRLQESLRRLLQRPEFAAEAIVDLARWQDWSAPEAIARLYDAPARLQPGVRRAVVGYLTTSPTPAAATELSKLRDRDSRGVSDAEAYLKAFGSLR